MKKLVKLAAIPAFALAAGIVLSACGSSTPTPTTAVTAPPPVAAAPATTTPAPQVIINNNNNPAPAQPAPVYVQPAAQSQPWSVALAYTSAINNGDNATAWNMLSASVQQGWNGNYYTYVANFTPLEFQNVTYVSGYGDSVTFTFTLHNVDTGWSQFTTCTFTVDNGIITTSA